VNAAWFESLAKRAMHASVYADPRFPPSPYYRFLRLLAAEVKPHLSVELGVCGGGGSLHLAVGWSRGTVVGIDHTQNHRENIEYVQRVCPNFRFWHGDSVATAPLVRREYGEVDILFIDTTHSYGQTLAEYKAWRPHLSERAVVCLDDLHRDEMAQAWDEIPGNKVRLDDLHTGPPTELGGGFGVVW
jgi:cephalosporin hydroxylase